MDRHGVIEAHNLLQKIEASALEIRWLVTALHHAGHIDGPTAEAMGRHAGLATERAEDLRRLIDARTTAPVSRPPRGVLCLIEVEYRPCGITADDLTHVESIPVFAQTSDEAEQAARIRVLLREARAHAQSAMGASVVRSRVVACSRLSDETAGDVSSGLATIDHAELYATMRDVAVAAHCEGARGTAAGAALDEISRLVDPQGFVEWEYPGQVVRDVKQFAERAESLSSRASQPAHDLQPMPEQSERERFVVIAEWTADTLSKMADDANKSRGYAAARALEYGALVAMQIAKSARAAGPDDSEPCVPPLDMDPAAEAQQLGAEQETLRRALRTVYRAVLRAGRREDAGGILRIMEGWLTDNLREDPKP